MNRTTLVALAVMAVGCTPADPMADAGAEPDAAPIDAASATDAATADDASAPVDAWVPVDARAADAWVAPDAPPACELVTAGATSLGACDDRWLSCRIRGSTTFCGDVSRSPRAEGASCSTITDCDRGLQCLRVRDTLSCRRFCDLADGDGDCSLGSTSCELPAIEADDGTAVTLPTGIGLCG